MLITATLMIINNNSRNMLMDILFTLRNTLFLCRNIFDKAARLDPYFLLKGLGQLFFGVKSFFVTLLQFAILHHNSFLMCVFYIVA